MIGLRDGDEAVIADTLLPVELFALEDPDKPGGHGATRKGRLIHQQQDIDGVAIGREFAWQKSEVVRKTHTRWQNLGERKDLLLGIESIFVTAALRCLDDDLQSSILFMDWLQSGRVG